MDYLAECDLCSLIGGNTHFVLLYLNDYETCYRGEDEFFLYKSIYNNLFLFTIKSRISSLVHVVLNLLTSVSTVLWGISWSASPSQPYQCRGNILRKSFYKYDNSVRVCL